MAKVELKNELQIKDRVTLKDMKLGDLAVIIGTNSGYEGELAFRTLDGIICLNDGDKWDYTESVNLEIRILEKGEQVILTQER